MLTDETSHEVANVAFGHIGRPSLCLQVEAIKAKTILVDHPVHAIVTRTSKVNGISGCAAIPEANNQLEHKALEVR